jgi:hypothetical protein
MKMKLACCAAALAFAASSGAYAATIVNVDSATNVGTTVSLAAGTYELAFIGQADGGLYDAWHAWSGVNAGCDGAGANCSRGWTVNLSVDFGNAGSYDRSNGQLMEPGDNHLYSTAAAALVDAQSGSFSYAAIGSQNNAAAFTSFGGPITFTLASAQDVNFFNLDIPFTDNKGGVSFLLNSVSGAVPEPSSWAMMIAGFGLMGTAMRRRKAIASFA